MLTANDQGWAAEAGAYNGLVTAWPNLRTGAATLAAAASPSQPSPPLTGDARGPPRISGNEVVMSHDLIYSKDAEILREVADAPMSIQHRVGA